MARRLTTYAGVGMALVFALLLVGCDGTTVPDVNGNGTTDNGNGNGNGGADEVTYDSLILAGSRTGHYAVVNPDTGEDIVEIAPDVHFLGVSTLGYQSERVFMLCPEGPGTGTQDIFACDTLTGDNVVQLTQFEGTGPTDLDGSPVEAKLVFAAWTDETPQVSHIYTMNEDGTGMTQLSFDEEPHTLLDGTAVLSLGEYLPAWSPDGTQIAYQARVGKVGSIGFQYEIVVVMNADGSSKEIIYERQGSAHFRELSWAHNGDFVMVGNASEDGPQQVLAVSVATTTVSNLTDDLTPDADFGYLWMSPTDFTIVFNHNVPGGGSLYTAQLQANGDTVSVVGGPTQLTADYSDIGHDYAMPDWAPATGTGGGQEPECTSDADCLAGQICVGGVCVADTGDELPDSLIVAGSRTGHYVIVDPETGEDIVEVAPDTIGTHVPTLGYQCERVYFLSAPTTGTGRVDLFGCDAMTGENVANLTADLTDFSAATPEGSPAGPKLAFTDTYDNYVYAINEDGTGLAQLTFDDETHTLLDGTAVIALSEHLPTWSPDGTQIAYQARVGKVGSIGFQYEIVVVMNADGSSKEIIYERQGSAHFRELAWSHNGDFVMVGNASEDGPQQVLAVSVATTTVSNLTDDLALDADFGYLWMSPTDFTIVFNYNVPGGGSLYTAQLQANGDTVSVVSGPTQLTADYSDVGHDYAMPDWAPYVP